MACDPDGPISRPTPLHSGDNRYLKLGGGPDKTVPFRAVDGSPSAPGYTFQGQSNTGLRMDADGAVWWVQGGRDLGRIADLFAAGGGGEGLGFWPTAGSGNAYTITPSPALGSYADGVSYLLQIDRANTGATTLAVSGLAAKALRHTDGSELASGDLQAGAVVLAVYSGLYFQAISGLAVVDGGTF